MGAYVRTGALVIALGVLGCSKDVSGPNLPPQASAGPDRVVAVGEAARLDGGLSRDPDGAIAAFAWTVVAAPAGADFELDGAAESLALLVPRARGDFLVRLVVRDAAGAEGVDVVRVRAQGGCLTDEECNDGLGCTVDRCVARSCARTPQDDLCTDDGLWCTGRAVCDPQQGCRESGDPCAPLALTCDEGTDACTGCQQDADCDDGVDCSVDTCVLEVCAHAADDGRCQDDGLHCNGDEVCDVLLGCGHSGDPCQIEARACDETSDSCVDCTLDAQCADTDLCTTDTCLAGACQHQAMDCDDQVGCTVDTCLDGQCAHNPDDARCEPDPDFCNGVELCDAQADCMSPGDPCEGGAVCADLCDEEKDSCLAPADTDCGDPTHAPPCNLADQCDGNGNCDPRHAPASTICQDTILDDCWAAACDGLGACDQQHTPLGLGVACRPSAGPCDLGELCGAQGGACPPDADAANGTPCGDPEPCAETCLAGQCLPEEAPDDAACALAGNPGICCGALCAVGAECCSEAPCVDENTCTVEACTAGECEPPVCTDPNCLALVAPGSGGVGTPLGLALHMCDEGMPADSFFCSSDRNLADVLLAADFEEDFGPLTPHGDDVDRTAAARSPLNSASTLGASVCGGGTGDVGWLDVTLSTAGRHDLLLRFAAADSTLDDNEMLGVYYRSCQDDMDPACEFRSLMLVGDDLNQEYREYQLLLPADAEDQAAITLSFFVDADNGNDCAFLDDVSLVDLPAMDVARELLSEDFEAPPYDFSLAGADATIQSGNGGLVLQLVDNRNASATATLDSRGADPQHLLVLRWSWTQALDPLGDDKYYQVQFSPDGSSWVDLAATGHLFYPTLFTGYRAVLPCEAYGLQELRVRFFAPDDSASDSNDAVHIDDVFLEEWHVDWTDTFGPVAEQGGGVYELTVTSGQAGTAVLQCRQGCGGGALGPASATVTFE